MCKLLIIPKVNKTKQVQTFVKAAMPEMTRHDKDGVGYAALGLDGTVFGERWLDPKAAFKSRAVIDVREAKAFKGLENSIDSLELNTSYNRFGKIQSEFTSIMVHTRMATSAKGMVNTHPFTRGETVLIHNGVLNQWNELDEPKQSTCDSEALLNTYVRHSIQDRPERFTEAVSDIRGYFAAGVYSKDRSSRYILDVVKDDRASLYVAYVFELDSLVFATTENIIRTAAKACKMRLGSIRRVKDCSLMRFDATSGQVVLTETFTKANEYASIRERFESRFGSLGDHWSDDVLVSDAIRSETETWIEYENGNVVKKKKKTINEE